MNVSLVILALTVASFLLGFLRDLFIARSFGLSWEADLIFVALILPLFFENFLGLALRDAMIPYLQKLRSQSQSLFEAVARWLYWRIMLLGGAACLLILLTSYWVLNALAPGWTPEQVANGQLVFCVGALLIGVQAALYCQGALLNMDNVFVMPMTRTLLLNAGAIIGILLFEPSGMVIFLGMLLPQLALIVVQHRRIHYLRGEAQPLEKGHGSQFGLAFAPVLMAAGACSSVDVVSILQKARQQVQDCEVELSAERADTVPRVFTKLHLHFVVTGTHLSEKQVERAVQLSADKYCSVSIMLSGSVAVSHSFSVIEAATAPNGDQQQ